MRTLSRKRAHRTSMIRNLATSLLLYESIETTTAKAKEIKMFIDKLIPRAKSGDLIATRYLASVLYDRNAVKKVINELVPRYAERSSGFVRIYKTGYRIGDNAPTAKVELVDKKVFVAEKTAEKASPKASVEAKAGEKKPAKAAVKSDAKTVKK